MVWGAKVHPKLARKIIGEASFPVLGAGKNISLEPKNQVFNPLRAMFGAPGHEPKIANEFVTLLQAKNNTFLLILPLNTMF